MSQVKMNGAPQRKSLASQLDRLDGIIDALADGLNQAVAGVVREAVTVAVQEAVQGLVGQLLTHPEVARRLAGPAPQEAPPAYVDAEVGSVPQPEPRRAGVARKLGRAWHGLRDRFGSAARAVRSGVGSTWSKARSALPGLGRRVRQAGRGLREHRRVVGWSLAAGLALGVGGYLVGPVASALALGACGAAMSLLAFLAAPFVRLWRAAAEPA
jgi:hypothetical protein